MYSVVIVLPKNIVSVLQYNIFFGIYPYFMLHIYVKIIAASVNVFDVELSFADNIVLLNKTKRLKQTFSF